MVLILLITTLLAALGLGFLVFKKTTLHSFLKLQTWRGVAIGLIVGISFSLGGFSLIHDHQNMGVVLFILLPVATGFAIGLVTRPPELLAGSVLLTVFTVCLILIKTGMEGVVCCLLASPLLACGIALGAVLGHYSHKKIRGSKANLIKFILICILPFGLMGAKKLEAPMFESPRTECITTTFLVPGSAQEAWNKIKSTDGFEGPKPFLLRIGLPIPQRCELPQEAVGATRICHFNVGTIEETVTEWDPPYRMNLKVTKVTLPGRKWLGFKEARYEFQAAWDSTKIIRKTTITSYLYPVWYWRPLERWGVESEHLYLFQGLFKDAIFLPEAKP